ncbi:Hsp70 family protein [Myxococcota bacterium]|nr:Hsp70 family protein [Myxococcota bacterium]
MQHPRIIRLGVDFGTTRTIVAALDHGNTPVIGFDTGDGDVVDAWPTLAATDGATWVFGPQAARRLHEPGWQGLRSFKRLLSGPEATADRVVPLGDHPTVGVLLTRFLAALREDLLTRSNLPGAAPDARLQVLAAVPAAASSTQRFLTMDAFRAAGFEVLGVRNEPTAAGVEYGRRHARTLNSKRERVLVYDLGGGTFDATVVHVGALPQAGDPRVQAHAGLEDLGGEDLDRALLDLALRALLRPEAALGALPAADRVRLLEHARQAKEAISPATRAVTVEVGAQLSEEGRAALGLDAEAVARVAVADFDQAVRPLVERSLALVDALLGGGGLDGAGVAGVYVVGGASSLPAVARHLREAFGRRVHRSPYPSAATAIGLAAALDDEGLGAPPLATPFGVFRERSEGRGVSFDLIFDPTAPLRDGEVVRRYRPAHNVGWFRFAACAEVDALGNPVGDLTPRGELRVPFDPRLRGAPVDAVPVARLSGARPLIEERYAWDADAGRVRVRFADLDSGWSTEHELALG